MFISFSTRRITFHTQVYLEVGHNVFPIPILFYWTTGYKKGFRLNVVQHNSKKLCHGSYPDVFLATRHYKSVIMEREHPGGWTQGSTRSRYLGQDASV